MELIFKKSKEKHQVLLNLYCARAVHGSQKVFRAGSLHSVFSAANPNIAHEAETKAERIDNLK